MSQRTDLCSVGRTVPASRLDALADLAATHGFAIDRLHADGRPVSAARLSRALAALG